MDEDQKRPRTQKVSKEFLAALKSGLDSKPAKQADNPTHSQPQFPAHLPVHPPMFPPPQFIQQMMQQMDPKMQENFMSQCLMNPFTQGDRKQSQQNLEPKEGQFTQFPFPPMFMPMPRMIQTAQTGFPHPFSPDRDSYQQQKKKISYGCSYKEGQSGKGRFRSGQSPDSRIRLRTQTSGEVISRPTGLEYKPQSKYQPSHNDRLQTKYDYSSWQDLKGFGKRNKYSYTHNFDQEVAWEKDPKRVNRHTLRYDYRQERNLSREYKGGDTYQGRYRSKERSSRDINRRPFGWETSSTQQEHYGSAYQKGVQSRSRGHRTDW